MEANSAQNLLQKEVTTLREHNRTMQLRLRDMEVSNDDFERQERIVMSSLEDVESKYNQSIERSVMLEEEIRGGELEREALRIELQRLRDELSDLKVEQEITVEKLNNTMAMAAKYGHGSLHHVPPPKFPSPLSDTSTVLTEDSPCTPATTPSGASASTPQSDHSGPPSPPISEISTTPPSQSSRITSPLNDPATTPRPARGLSSSSSSSSRPKKHSRGPSLGAANSALPMPTSRSLNQIRGLIGQMQRLEQRVQSARSKLPGPPLATPPRPPLPPPPPPPLLRTAQMPSPINMNTVTLRSHKKTRTPSLAASAASAGERAGTPGFFSNRLSYSAVDRPVSRAVSRIDRAGNRTQVQTQAAHAQAQAQAANVDSRPSSRASTTTSRSSLSGGLDRSSAISQRPQSRASMSGRATPLGSHGDYDMASSAVVAAAGSRVDRRSVGGEDRAFGFGIRRNTLNSNGNGNNPPGSGSAIPLPRKGYGGRLSTAGTRTFVPEDGGSSPISPPNRAASQRLPAKGFSDKWAPSL